TDLRRTITAPLDRLGYRFDNPGIVDDMLAETGDALIDLPLVQFACRALWDARDQEHRLLLASAYRNQGGVAGALAGHAEQVIDAMTADEQRISRELLGRLVVGSHARRIVEREALLEGLPAGAAAVLDRLVSARLLAQHRPAGANTFSVELAHESLLVNWTQLRHWLEESGEERRLLHELDDAAGIWERLGAGDEGTWPEAELAVARSHAKGLALVLPARIDRFLSAGEAHHRRRRRRRRVWASTALVAIGILTAVGAGVISRYLAREERIRTNLGTIELDASAYDRAGHTTVPVPLDELALTWRLYQAAEGDQHEPGVPFPTQLVEISSTRSGVRLTAPGGTVFLAVSGRGRHGETCAPSWVRIASFPGYAAARQHVTIEVPTCQATRFAMVEVHGGDFVYGGAGEPPSKRYGEADYTIVEQVLMLPSFAMDRTEVSNGAYEPFKKFPANGYPAPEYSLEPAHEHSSDADRPVTSVDSFAARAFCRYLGKELPTDRQWVKASRGGLVVGGHSNPHPRRLFPWGIDKRAECVNDDGDDDGWIWVAPVDAFACGASPYGILNLVGNVQEWISRIDQPDPQNPLQVQRGGGVDAPPEYDLTTTLFVNHRLPRDFTYSTGFRCVENQGQDNAR
ncbi:MAG: SUMF1/EgtB/PvdO family nonheme iron enzyme, partial [Rhodoglobus sp.]